MATTISSTTNTSGTLAASGVGSGLDIAGLVSKLMAVENQKLAALDNQKSSFQSKVSAYGQVKSALGTFQAALAALKNPSSLSALSASSTDYTTVVPNAGSGAAAGTYAVQVTQLAKAAKLASAGYAATSDTVGTGTLTFDFGTYASGQFASSGAGVKTVTIGAAQQSLTGIRDAVNAANIGVTASIVNDGSANGNRLVFTASATGAVNSMKVTVADADGNNTDAAGLSALAFDPTAVAGSGKNMEQKIAAQDAKLTVDGIDMSKATNVVSDAIEGVTLTLVKETTGDGAKVTVSSDTSAPTKAVNDFVTAYNTLLGTLKGLTKYDATAKKGSVLTGDSLVRSIQSRVSAVLGNMVPGLSNDGSSTATLRQAGISLKADGSLSVDATKLAAVAKSADGIGRLFGAVAKATDSAITSTASGTATVAGTYSLNISQLATQGTLVGSAAATLDIVAGTNDTLDVTVDGITATVTLSAKTYASADALAAEVQSKINGATAIANGGSQVKVTNNAGVLTLTSTRYGSASKVALAGNGASAIAGGSPLATLGLDVAGTINGVAGTGSGKVLKAATGSAAEGLALTVEGGATGDRGTVTFSRGYASQLDAILTDFLDSDGAVASRTDGLNKSITDLGNQRTAMEARLAKVQATYQAQFNALDTALGKMQVTSSYLTQQLAAIKANSGTSG
ncbi:MAG: flagellar filament capping protein FliD [Burkholderiales bacterium]